MTNSEIIEGLKAIRTIHNGNYAPYVDEAIKRISAEPCGDYISRQEAINKMQELEDEDIKAYGCEIPEGFDGKRAIRALKTLQPAKSKTGHWTKYGIPRCGEQHYKCSSCGYYINFGQWGELYTKEFKYCPHCGIKMSEEESESKGDE